MRLKGRRTSDNVDDRRGSSAGIGKIGIGGIIVAALLAWATGGDPLSAIMQAVSNAPAVEQTQEFSPEEQELATFASQILAGTEDVWTQEFEKMGRTYEPPRLVLFSGSVQSG